MKRIVLLAVIAVLVFSSLGGSATAAHPTSTTATTRAQPAPNGDFDIFLQDGNTAEFWWIANYLRTLPSGTGWVGGDRSGYFCAYMFLLNSSGTPLGRVTFTRVDVPREEGGNYAYIKDEDMEEGARYFDGTPAPAGSNEIGDCPPPTQTYEPWAGPDQRPTVLFSARRGGVLETRDYKVTDAHPDVMFRQTEKLTGQTTVFSALGTPSTIWGRVPVVAYVNGLPTIVVYYDSLVRGVSVTSDIG